MNSWNPDTQLRAFWWFQDGLVAGMARPGFNRCRWNDLDLEEGALYAWFGNQRSDHITFEGFQEFLEGYGCRLASFFGLALDKIHRCLSKLVEPTTLKTHLRRLQEKTELFEAASLDGGLSRPKLSSDRVNHELVLLQQLGIRTIVTLTETPPGRSLLEGPFQVHHFPTEDMFPPSPA